MAEPQASDPSELSIDECIVNTSQYEEPDPEALNRAKANANANQPSSPAMVRLTAPITMVTTVNLGDISSMDCDYAVPDYGDGSLIFKAMPPTSNSGIAIGVLMIVPGVIMLMMSGVYFIIGCLLLIGAGIYLFLITKEIAVFIADAQTGTFSKKIGKVVKPYPLSGAVFHFMPVAPKTLPTGRQVFDLPMGYTSPMVVTSMLPPPSDANIIANAAISRDIIGGYPVYELITEHSAKHIQIALAKYFQNHKYNVIYRNAF